MVTSGYSIHANLLNRDADVTGQDAARHAGQEEPRPANAISNVAWKKWGRGSKCKQRARLPTRRQVPCRDRLSIQHMWIITRAREEESVQSNPWAGSLSLLWLLTLLTLLMRDSRVLPVQRLVAARRRIGQVHLRLTRELPAREARSSELGGWGSESKAQRARRAAL